MTAYWYSKNMYVWISGKLSLNEITSVLISMIGE